MRMLLALLLLVAMPLWAAEPKELDWPALIPEGAPVIPPQLAPLHDMSQLSNALAAESAPARAPASPRRPGGEKPDGQQVKLPGYIVPLEVSEEGRTTEFLLVPYLRCVHPCAAATVESDRAHFQRDGRACRRPLPALLDRGKDAG
ncbi:DUF3299 domain-containing protein [Pseudomonas peli]|uniref:DUF3299 domain-containing protein n=1 Tax=Pseudomonas peli TaxID=592361 RepID=UPI003D15864F